ncbi:hypothetical protein TSTA_021620 [Talaromyces stipitatus ATCC 10500]|uniref:methylisocitrate lyase n=1 Tax=Talaromyces stipitatus (strain ATCC 10500 / CBS 375.48 / QM 6759 / NRRL 1006) TaxID=441959 RepID=B8MHC6_TALSN|nr:uncharacterized protein TSTA_021620 [Talaromyces stipitatus ATCC 10500]EED17105.1 hypothetical protein TSTA_021620 [Talaromyces stipitatus ATCC 10500]
MPQVKTTLDAEREAFDKEVAEIEAWWESTERIAALRGTVKQKYSSSEMALKLWDQMIEHEKNGTRDLTFGCTDPLQAGVMAKHQQGKFLFQATMMLH